MDEFPYSIPADRALTNDETSLIRRLIELTCPTRLSEVSALRIRARCGCGNCPTIMFVENPEREGAHVLADFKGGSTGIVLWEREGQLTELEAWSIDGSHIDSWPDMDTLEPLN